MGANKNSRGWILPAVTLALLVASPAFGQQVLEEPFTPSARWHHYLYRTYSPVRLAQLAADTAIDHGLRDPRCWDTGADAYARRFGRAMERRAIRNTTELLGGLLTGEDLRYHPSTSRVFRVRVWNALRSSVTARMPDGSLRPAYTRFAANTVANLATVTWPHQPIQTSWLGESIGWSIIGQSQTNLLDEFGPDLRRVGLRMWRHIRH